MIRKSGKFVSQSRDIVIDAISLVWMVQHHDTLADRHLMRL